MDALCGLCEFDKEELERRLRENMVEECVINEILERYPEDYRCRRPKYSESEAFCIFHAEKKPDNFWDLFRRELERMERESESLDFSGFIFPEFKLIRGGKPFTLSKPACFVGAKFQGEADFRDVEFQGEADFRGASFQVACFVNAKFQEADFRNVRFEVADFTSVDFREANFIAVKFQVAYFTDAEFGIADFRCVEFREIADFMCAEFEVADFASAKFHGIADFRSVEFKGIADFTSAEFEVADFRGAKFHGIADFTHCRFKRVAFFMRTVFEENVIFIAPDRNPSGLMILATTLFNKPKYAFISGFPLSNLSFLLTDLTDVNLIPPKSPRTLSLLDERLLSKEELGEVERRVLKLLKGSGLLSTETLVLELRSIRKNLEANKLYSEAGELHIKEICYRRKLIKERGNLRDIPEYIANWFYSLLGCGESIMRPVLGMILTVVLSALYLAFKSISPQGVLQRALENVPIMVSILFQIRSLKDFAIGIPMPELIAVEVLVRTLALVLFGMLFIALRRKLERR
ncbi:MAG: pentapeptide repeat-containing protein [Candidatus Korarchaeum sp.]|nr:pentapeptide repeat-containing protein [Candidatus Korarchaeum sp.]MDW8036015.1 pentapeptide repeat-containing protein [Candidatus Korarchaeum sp.]